MNEWQERVVKERGELVEKADKLSTFLHSARAEEIADVDRTLLILQHKAMAEYATILEWRIARFR